MRFLRRACAAALALALALAGPNPAFASSEADFAEAIQELAAARPYEPFARPDLLPPRFKESLGRRTGYPAVLLSNARVCGLYRDYLRGELAAGQRPRGTEEREPARFGSQALEAAPQAARSPQAAFDGVSPPPAASSALDAAGGPSLKAPSQDPPLSKRGPRLLGIEFGAGQDPLEHDNEPYLKKGVEQVLDWDIRARLALDGAGASAKYRHPEGFRSLSVGFLKFFDWPDTIGLNGTRDGIYRMVGQVPDKPQGGFELGASGAVNEYFGGNTTWDQRQSLRGDRYVAYTSIGLGAGWSPLGDNKDKPWNYTLLGAISRQKAHISGTGYSEDRDGLGYSLGVAFQHALNDLPIPVIQPHPSKDGDFFLDRLKLGLTAARSQIASFSVQAAAEVSFFLYRHLELNVGVNSTYLPSPDPRNPYEQRFGVGAIVGVDLRY